MCTSAEYQSSSLSPEFFNQVNQQALSLHLRKFDSFSSSIIWRSPLFLPFRVYSHSFWLMSRLHKYREANRCSIYHQQLWFINRFRSLVVITLRYLSSCLINSFWVFACETGKWSSLRLLNSGIHFLHAALFTTIGAYH